jgi:hypothetical protein
MALVIPNQRTILLKGRDRNGLVLKHGRIIWSVITMFRTRGHRLKLAQISCWSAKVKVFNRIDLQAIFQNHA